MSTYPKMKMAKLCSANNDGSIDGTLLNHNFCHADVFFDLLQFDSIILISFISKTMSDYRGVQFAEGTIFLQGFDTDTAFKLEDSERKKYGIRKIEPTCIPGENGSVFKPGCIVTLDPLIEVAQHVKVMDFLIDRIIANENWTEYVERDSK